MDDTLGPFIDLLVNWPTIHIGQSSFREYFQTLCQTPGNELLVPSFLLASHARLFESLEQQGIGDLPRTVSFFWTMAPIDEWPVLTVAHVLSVVSTVDFRRVEIRELRETAVNDRPLITEFEEFLVT